ncbi:hypothetical protein [Porphyrobacter sp. AAP60]|uniref:hypothetical protein n=1 Tax=Porphyrobacter sp. AAP60 TaxID=1523423 RepID=UPI0006B99C5F|nr:hypothetical protein [Porphyrobacter sp. AAP60]KPF62169.1 hypothetical protein IP79_13225 [Porphyrobacter sp. AAP60]
MRKSAAALPPVDAEQAVQTQSWRPRGGCFLERKPLPEAMQRIDNAGIFDQNLHRLFGLIAEVGEVSALVFATTGKSSICRSLNAGAATA